MTTVVVTGAAGRVGRRVLALLAADPDVERVVALDATTVPVVDPKIERHRIDEGGDDTGALLRGADALVHLAHADGEGAAAARRGRGRRNGAAEPTARLLDDATAAGIRQVVALSSALVYGAWPNNPLPL